MNKSLSYQQTGYFSPLILDYLAQKPYLQNLYQYFPTLENFKKQIELKQNSYLESTRNRLVKSLNNQYQNTAISPKTKNNLELLTKENTFTITTGHQLNLFTGPLYFFYKIISVINLTEQLNNAYAEYNFVPVYWMATEDHDFDEINFFNFKQQKLEWKVNASGPVGELKTEQLDEVFKQFESLLNQSTNAKKLKELFINSYFNQENLAEATQYLVNELFGEYGLVIVDSNKKELKKEFIPFIKSDIFQNTAYKKVSKTKSYLEKSDYKVQVNPREINFFYQDKNLRERIIFQKNSFYVNNTDLVFSPKEIEDEIDKNPQKFSPNVILRPLYQETILPNLAYIGGGGEIAYWLELKSFFDAEKTPFPILFLRNSALLVLSKQFEKLEKLEVSIEDLFLKTNELKTVYTEKVSQLDIDFSKQKQFLEQQFQDLYQLAKKTDQSFLGAVAAQEKKQKNGLDHLEKRLLKAQKRKFESEINRVLKLQEELFPNQNLQERVLNFSEFYEAFGDQLIEKLKENLNPLNFKFSIIQLDN
ncbi:bacillithiol biosynthesis cysteine-adding enzyme BshC [Mesonia sp. K7]|uniref:bacillithiol biosynthesis cysteine-adding enzyme BshC n=1 Tax=Mesonia sp. K7 TaxID=2218606 RepID=UPI000DA99AA9|nr:bacillithiol biosynthesis cysteine-adding enzyme BshC [Mesonia sp. K7]PZD77288.1 bacillithiol biosynthesis cysteine-adding enzyme BshC [Mesonia sp. K7]